MSGGDCIDRVCLRALVKANPVAEKGRQRNVRICPHPQSLGDVTVPKNDEAADSIVIVR